MSSPDANRQEGWLRTNSLVPFLKGEPASHAIIVKKHNGTLTLESQEGEGTTIHIGLPLETETEEDE